MKFGEHLRKQRLPQWRFFYLDYDGLKNTLKKTTENSEWADKDDQLFIDRLVIELDKVHSFYALKLGETQRRIQSCQRRIQTLSMSQHPALSEYLSIQNEITDITSEVQELFWYTRLNYTGFLKIVKKHDRYAEQVPKLRGHFLTLLHHRPFYKAEAFSQLTTELAKLYDSARVNGNQPFNDFSTITPPSVITPIVRQHQPLVYRNTKYWVHPDNVMDVKTHILKYMPLISQNASSSPHTTGPPSTPPSLVTDPVITHAAEERCSDELISSVYLDDRHFSSYMSRVQFLADQRTIRLRWYGNDTRNVHVERKSYNYVNHDPVEGLPATQDQYDESSTKDRHTLKAKAVIEWLRGDWSVSEKLQKAQQKRQSNGQDWMMEDDDDMETERLRSIAQDIQDLVVEEQLRPVVRTVFRRTVFQSPDEFVRISMDTDFVMAREFGWNDPESPLTEPWRRDDLTAQIADEDQYLDIPNEPTHPDDYHRFRYAIVEVKIRTPQYPTQLCSADSDEPDCIKTLVRARMMEPIPHFSKYVHAVSVLWESNVPLLPFWVSNPYNFDRRRV
jgi:SPX domain protein involved in polyphosphate accumulation